MLNPNLKNQMRIPLAGQRSHWALDGVLKPLRMTSDDGHVGFFLPARVDFSQVALKFFPEPISKMSFGPISLLVPRFKSSTYNKYASGLKLGSAAILNQNPISEMDSNTKVEWHMEGSKSEHRASG